MLSFYEVIDRAVTGQLMSDQDFYLKHYVPKLQKVVQQYKIKYNPETPLPCDDALADTVFDAAVEFFSEAGAYCPDTSRVLRFSKEEILQAAREAPRSDVR
jgi:methylamine--corrinoid protein Co-methyltransferase